MTKVEEVGVGGETEKSAGELFGEAANFHKPGKKSQAVEIEHLISLPCKLMCSWGRPEPRLTAAPIISS